MKTELLTPLFSDRVSNVPQNFIREILKVASNPSILSFAGGLPNPQLFPVEALSQAATKVFMSKGQQALQYNVTEGYRPLREYIAERYRSRCGLDISADQVLITNGSQQALDIIGKLFINPGDHILLERPTYLGALQCLSMFEPVFNEVTLLDDGPDLEELDEKLSSRPIKLFYGIPDFQNPTGRRYSLERRKDASLIFERHGTLVIEDDPYGEVVFNNDRLPHLFSFRPDHTILLGSFSKIIAPGLRLGWMIANEGIIKKATVMKQASDLHSGNLTQFILYQFLCDHNLDDHIGNIRDTYRKQCGVMIDGLREFFPKTIKFSRPEGGMFTWVTLADGITSRTLLDRAIKNNIVFVPGDTFYAGVPDAQTLRLNFSNVEPVKMRDALKVLGGLV